MGIQETEREKGKKTLLFSIEEREDENETSYGLNGGEIGVERERRILSRPVFELHGRGESFESLESRRRGEGEGDGVGFWKVFGEGKEKAGKEILLQRGSCPLHCSFLLFFLLNSLL